MTLVFPQPAQAEIDEPSAGSGSVETAEGEHGGGLIHTS